MGEIRGSGMEAGFIASFGAVKSAASFLLGQYGGRTIADQGQCQDLADHVDHQIATLAQERPSRLRVLVLGEFKAGKSSLINCLVGKPVAATDVGELTAAVCRIVPADRGREFVRMRSAEVGQPVLEFSVPEFLAESKAHGVKVRSGERSRLDGYASADLYVQTSLPVELVDTPGLGAARRNEKAAMDALAQADLVLLTVDSDNIGGARDAVLMERIQASGQPLLVAMTKIDLLEDDEYEEVIGFVIRSYGISRELLFPVSSRQFERTGKDVGVERLIRSLEGAAPSRASFRDRALLSQVRDLSTELAAGLGVVESAVEEALEDVRENQKVLQETASVVTRDICLDVSSMIRQKLQAEAEGILLGQIHNRAARLTEADFAAALEQSIGNIDAKPFWDRLRTSLESRFQKEWSDGIKSQLEILNSNLEQHRQEMRTDTAALSDHLVREELSRLERKKHAIGNAVAAGVTAITMLVTGFPLILVAAAVLPGAWVYYENKMATEREATMGEIEYAVRMDVSEWVNEYVRSVVAEFQGKLLRENLSVAQMASDGYGRKREDFPGTEADLTELLGEVRSHLLSMSALTAGSRLLPSDA